MDGIEIVDGTKIRVVKKSDAISWRRKHPPIKEEIRESINDILE